jgi:hypothetical protein
LEIHLLTKIVAYREIYRPVVSDQHICSQASLES